MAGANKPGGMRLELTDAERELLLLGGDFSSKVANKSGEINANANAPRESPTDTGLISKRKTR
jgi:hypothetical protein